MTLSCALAYRIFRSEIRQRRSEKVVVYYIRKLVVRPLANAKRIRVADKFYDSIEIFESFRNPPLAIILTGHCHPRTTCNCMLKDYIYTRE